MIGQTVSHYRILDELGAGGMGVVYRAEDVRLGRQVAVKFLHEVSRDRQAIDRFNREARTSSALNHPHVCTVFDVGEHDGHPFLVMELLEGQTLRSLINGRSLEIDQLIDLSIQICEALEAAHSEGIVHRDIKPANIFVTRRGQVKVLDFGLAKLAAGARLADASGLLTAGHHSTLAGVTVGTVAYMSPEQARGEDLDVRTDLFSFGLVLYEMTTGRQTFDGMTTAVIFDAILNKTPPPTLELNGAVPAELDRIVHKAIEKDKQLRYQTASDLRSDMQRLKRDRNSSRKVAISAAALAAATSNPASSSVSAAQVAKQHVARPRRPLPKSVKISAAVAGMVLLGALGFVATRQIGQLVNSTGDNTTETAASVTPAPIVTPAPSAPVSDSGSQTTTAGASNPALVPPPSPSVPPSASADGSNSSSVAAEPTGPAKGTEQSRPASPVVKDPTVPQRTTGTPTPPAPAKTGSPAKTSAPGKDPAAKTKVAAGTESLAVEAFDTARARFESKQYDDAVLGLQQILTEYSNSRVAPDAQLLLARAREAQGRFDDASQGYLAFRDRYREDARVPEVVFRAGQALRQSSRPGARDEARKIFGQLAAQFPESSWSLRALANKASLEEGGKVFAYDPMLAQQVPAALLTYRDLTERYPTESPSEPALWKLGEMYEELKRFDLAAQAFSNLATRFPTTKFDAWFRAAELYDKKVKDSVKARAAYAKVPQSSPRYRDAQKRAKE